jgi:hypothetical protein
VTVLNITAASAGGTAAAQAECYVRLLTGGSYGGGHSGTVIGRKEHFTLENDGTYTFADGELAPNSEIEPEGTVYHFRVNGADYYIDLPATGGPYDLSDSAIWTEPTPPVRLIQGEAGGNFDSGTLAARPAATVPPTSSGYFATDDNGGTFYGNPDGVSWEQLAPSVDDVGGIVLASVAPSSLASINPTFATPTRIPEFTTGSFTMPDKPVRAIMSPVQLTTAADPNFTYALHWTTNGWTGNTQAIVVKQHLYDSGTSRTIANISGRITATAGDTVQVALYVVRLSGASAVTACSGFLDVVSF